MSCITLLLVTLTFWVCISCINKVEYIHDDKIQSFISIDTIISTGLMYNENFNFDYLSYCIFGDIVYVFSGFNMEKQILKVLRYDIMKKKLTRISLDLPQTLEGDNDGVSISDITGLTANEKYLTFFFHSIALIYSYDGNVYQFHTFKDFKEPYMYIKHQDDDLLLGRCYNHHPESAPTTTKIIRYNVAERFISDSIFPNFDAIELSHFFPNTWIDYSDNTKQTLLSNAINYDIRIFDNKFRLLDSLKRTPKNWKQFDMTIINNIRNAGYRYPPRKIISELKEQLRNEGSRITSANFIGDSAILVAYTAQDYYGKKDRINFYDIWKYSNGKWIIDAADLINEPAEPNKIYSDDEFQFLGSQGYPAFSSGKVIIVLISAPDSVMRNSKYSFGEIDTQKEKFLSKNNLMYQILIYKVGL